MMRILFYVAIVIVVLHGLIHLMGFVAYWPLGEFAELPYKTTFLNGRLNLSQSGMQLFSALFSGSMLLPLLLWGLRSQPQP